MKIEIGSTSGTFNNSDMDVVTGTKLGKSNPGQGSGNGIVLKAVQTAPGKYQVQTRGGLNNSFAFRKEELGGVVIILQPFGSDGNALDTALDPHRPFYGTTEPPFDNFDLEFTPIALSLIHI